MRSPAFSLLSIVLLTGLCAGHSVAAQGAIKAKAIIYLVDGSGSMQSVEDTTQPFICHQLKTAELSGEGVAVAVIFFNGEGIRVFPSDGKPTTAHRALHRDLVQHWPAPKGSTPMDEAFQRAVKIVGSLPQDADVTLVLITDGIPDSGRLRPEAFPDVKTEIDRRVKAIQANKKGYPPEIVQQLLARLEREKDDPGTEFFKQVYAVQGKAEFKATLDHAQSLKQAKVRFISVDYLGGILELKQIHDAAGGKDQDLLIVKPASTVIAKLHGLGLTALPKVVVQDPIQMKADPKAFERTIPLKLDAVGDRALVTLVFEPPVADFDRHLNLEAAWDGGTAVFSLRNDDPNRILSLDSAGRVATAHLFLEQLPQDRQLLLTLRSPMMSMGMPACACYAHLRVSADVEPQFRPQFARPETTAPFRVSPNQDARWITLYRSKDAAKPYPVKSIEAILRNVHTGAQVRLGTHADPQVAHSFCTDAQRIPRGTFDVTLETILESGARIQTVLPRHVESTVEDEYVAVEITQQAGKGVVHASHHPGYVDFGEVGDDRTKETVAITVRSMGVPHDLPIEVSIDGLIDPDGKSPRAAWIVVNRPKLVLRPGKAETLTLTLSVPAKIEEELVDGLWKGRMSFTRKDIGEPMAVKRFQTIHGVSDETAVDQVTFTLRRPQLHVRAPRCLRDTLRQGKDGQLVLPVQVSIHRPHSRSLTLTVSHTSVLSRDVTVAPEGTFVDAEGRQLPSVRLVHVEPVALTQAVSPCAGAAWKLHFAADEHYPLVKACGRILISAPGLPTVHLNVEVQPRPLLGIWLCWALWCMALVMSLLLLLALMRFLKARSFRTGKVVRLSEDTPLNGYVEMKVTGKDTIILLPQQPVNIQFGDESVKRLGEHHPLSLRGQALELSRALRISELRSDGEPGWAIALTEQLFDPPEVHGEIESAPAEEERAARYAKQAWRRFVLTASLALLAFACFSLMIVRTAQWFYDFFTL